MAGKMDGSDQEKREFAFPLHFSSIQNFNRLINALPHW
jgi:hypothetical protein